MRYLVAAGLLISALVGYAAQVHIFPATLSVDVTSSVPKTLQGHCRDPRPLRGAQWEWIVRDTDILNPITTNKSAVTLSPAGENGTSWVVGICRSVAESALVTVTGFDEPDPGEGILADAADAFVESISVQTHIERQGSVYGEWTTGANVKAKICELGVRYTREILQSDSDAQNKFGQLVTCGKQRINTEFGLSMTSIHNKGVRLMGGCWPVGGNYGDGSHCISRANAYGDSVVAVFDGWNEVDNKLASWTGPWEQWQITLYNVVKNNASWDDRPVLANSLSHAGDATAVFNSQGNQAGVVDYGNMHSYPSGDIPSVVSNDWIPNWNQLVTPKPLMATETGYHNCQSCPNNGVSELAQAKYMGRLLFEYWNRDVVRTNIYQLMDEGPTPYAGREDAWGLVRRTGAVKPSYTTIKNIIDLLEDPGSPITPGRLDYALSDDLATTHKTLLQKRNGRFYLVLWREISVYNNTTDVDISNSPDAVTLTVLPAASDINVYQPRLGTSVIQSGSGTSINLNVPDEVIIVEIVP